MSESPAPSRLSRSILAHLVHPRKFRIALSATMLAVWYLLYFSSSSEHIADSRARVILQRKRLATVRAVDRLKRSLAPYRDLVGSGDVQEIMRRLMQRVRALPLRLVDLVPEKPKDLGHYQAIGLRINLQGKFADLDGFLGEIEAEKRLLRIDSLRLTPDTRQPGWLSAQLTLVALAEKATPPPKADGEAGKKR